MELNLDLPEPITIQEAKKASLRHVTEMPYPDCFGCGSARSDRDGLHLRAGPVEGRDLVDIDGVPLSSSVGTREGRKITLAGSMHDEAGAVLVVSRLVFITLKKE